MERTRIDPYPLVVAVRNSHHEILEINTDDAIAFFRELDRKSEFDLLNGSRTLRITRDCWSIGSIMVCVPILKRFIFVKAQSVMTIILYCKKMRLPVVLLGVMVITAPSEDRVEI